MRCPLARWSRPCRAQERRTLDTPALVDAVPLVAVITTGVTSAGVAVWTTRQNAKLARENRTYQRLADSYLEVLRLVEREAKWAEGNIERVQLAVTNVKSIRKEMIEIGDNLPENWHATQRWSVKDPESTVIADRLTIKAYLAAFASETVRGLYDTWRDVVTAIDKVLDHFPYDEKMVGDLRVLQPQESAARQVLANAIGEELGRRRPAAARWRDWFRTRA